MSTLKEVHEGSFQLPLMTQLKCAMLNSQSNVQGSFDIPIDIMKSSVPTRIKFRGTNLALENQHNNFVV